ncbi:recombinase family protein [Sporosalibacterium faouarense]|uniref:recombinase family protein n=1 Tax=Sporosalibacterium faouarense TaxID=516123 RepID=UPI00192AAE0A|nr:recombinase family protein [Sporosalibacterium faouarense]
MKIAIYSRKSRFTGKGESTRNQIDMCKEYANNHFSVDSFIIYEDEGFSGSNSDRPEYQRMLKAAKSGKFDVLICYRLDRISRNISDFSDTIETLERNDISFVSLKEQFDTSTPMGRAMLYIASVFAQLERETIAERIRDNMLSLARSGRWLGGKTPTGYESEPITYFDSNMNKKTMYKLKQVPKEIEIVKKVFRKYLEFGSLNQIEVWSTMNNITTVNNKFFDITAAKGILTNMVYVKADDMMYEYCKRHNMDIASNKSEFDGKHGLMTYNKNIERKGKSHKLRDKSEWIVAVGNHKGIIDSFDFIKIQEMLNQNKFQAPREGTSKVGLINTLLKCKNCGSRFRILYGTKRSDGTRPHYYKCRLKEKSKGTKCSVPNLKGEQLDELVVNHIKSLAKDTGEYFNTLNQDRDYARSQTKLHEDNTKELISQLNEKEKIISNLTIQLGENEASTASKYIIKKIEELDKDIKSLKKIINNADEKKENSLYQQKNIDMIQHLLTSFAEDADELEHNEKKKMLNMIVDQILWDGENLEIKVFGE